MRKSRALAASSVALLLLTAFIPTVLGVENRLPEGTHDGFDQLNARRGECYANGWAVDPDDVDAPVTVRILVDGAILTEIEATEYRQDIVDAGIDPDGTAGFLVFMGDLGITFDVTHSILIEARDAQTAEWRRLDGSPRAIMCSNLQGFHDAESGIVSREDCVAAGWAADRDTQFGSRARVRIRVDGKVVAEVTADQFRQDVLDAGIGDGFYGWSVNLFGKVTPNVEHIVRAEMRDTTLRRLWLPLFETDKTLTCLPNGVPSSHAGSANGAL
jgi:hypothetical protein